MSSRSPVVDVEKIQTTRSEKALAVVLAVFLLIGAGWVYEQLGDAARGTFEARVEAEDRAAVARLDVAEIRVLRGGCGGAASVHGAVTAREAYRTALDADEPAQDLRRAYERRQRDVIAAEAARNAADADADAVRPAALAAADRIATEEQRAHDRGALLAFVLRLAALVALLAAGLWLLGRLRRAGSRWLPVAFAPVGAATVLALFLAGDYVSDYLDPLDFGPLVISLVGIVLTLVGFAALQRYLARRIPARRVRKGECPFCGYPAGRGDHCEGCGRNVVADCATCAGPRRVGTLHCRACGAS